MRRIAIVAVAACIVVPARPASPEPVPSLREGAQHAVPLYGQFLRPYDAPEDRFAPGHRGVDIGAPMGTAVRASAAGVVSFSGVVAGNRSVTVDHGGGLVTSYSFLATNVVRAGDTVAQGQPVGTVGTGHPGSELGSHVHLSARHDGVYFDPLKLYMGSSHADLLSITR
jgi:murein DD-endopeptidase MepM/ murein hydrolase activator NlpD